MLFTSAFPPDIKPFQSLLPGCPQCLVSHWPTLGAQHMLVGCRSDWLWGVHTDHWLCSGWKSKGGLQQGKGARPVQKGLTVARLSQLVAQVSWLGVCGAGWAGSWQMSEQQDLEPGWWEERWWLWGPASGKVAASHSARWEGQTCRLQGGGWWAPEGGICACFYFFLKNSPPPLS